LELVAILASLLLDALEESLAAVSLVTLCLGNIVLLKLVKKLHTTQHSKFDVAPVILRVTNVVIESHLNALFDGVWWVSESLDLNNFFLLNHLQSFFSSSKSRRSSFQLLSRLIFSSTNLNSLH